MRKGLSLLLLSGALFTAFGAGYRIPEQSVRSTGTVASYLSGARHADSVYFNPANMSWLEGGWLFEGGVRYILLPRITYKGLVYDPVRKTYVYACVKSAKEEFIVPYFHLVSPEVNNFRFGLSFTTPAGLAKKWGEFPASVYAQEFTLKVYELDLALSYKFNEKFSVGGGLRAVYAEGRVKASYPTVYSVTMDGNTDVKPGYYLALSFRPVKQLNLSALYRSKVDLDLSGSAWGYTVIPTPAGLVSYPILTGGSVSVPLPAELRLSAAWRWRSTTFEFTFERVFWSSYDWLDFNYEDPVAEQAFGTPKLKDWEDVNTYRLSVSHSFGKKFEGMLGIAYSESPIPTKSVGFELPEPKYTWIVSAGALYKPSPTAELGLAYLYLPEGNRKVDNPVLKGEFTDISAHLLTLSLGLRF